MLKLQAFSAAQHYQRNQDLKREEKNEQKDDRDFEKRKWRFDRKRDEMSPSSMFLLIRYSSLVFIFYFFD